MALITGGARRVGRAVALHLAQAGWDVAITFNRSNDDAASLQREIETLGRRCLTVQADFEDPETAASVVGEAIETKLGVLSLLMHNASIYEPGRLAETGLDQLRQNWAVHCETPLLLTQRLRPMLESAHGTVLTMTDIDVERSRPSHVAYAMTKAALANLTRQLARELAPDVTVNAIAPGAVLWEPGISEDDKAAFLSRVPLERSGDPSDIAKLVEFLCTGGRYITGQTLRVDGGRTIR